MAITRRAFLEGAAATLVLPRFGAAPQPGRCTILDLGDRCALAESLAGYRALLANAEPNAPLLVVPGALEFPALPIHACLWRGGTVILESGELPLELRPGRAPYVDFVWPIATKVRDFSKVSPVAADRGDIIATVDGIPVASRRRVGLGTLIHLGTPLGPALWFGDREARQWLEAVVGGA